MSGTTNIPCCYVMLKKGDKALFVLRQNTGFQDGNYGFVAGHVEHGESYKEGIIREAEEEVGLILNASNLRHVHTMHRYQTPENIRVDVFFETERWTGEVVNKEPSKHAEVTWLELASLPDNVQDFTAFAIKQILQGQTYSEFGWPTS